MPILTGLGALYAPFDLEAGSDGFNTGFAFPEVLMAMVAAARAGDWAGVHEIYARFAALIVFEQQPGVAIRKELLRRRGLLASARARHPGATITPAVAKQLDAVLERTLPGLDLTRPLELTASSGQLAAGTILRLTWAGPLRRVQKDPAYERAWLHRRAKPGGTDERSLIAPTNEAGLHRRTKPDCTEMKPLARRTKPLAPTNEAWLH